MLLTVNKVNEVLSGVNGDDKYSIPYTKESYDALLDLETKFDSAASFVDAQELVDQAKVIITNASQKQGLALYGDSLKFDNDSGKFYLYSKAKDVTSIHALPKVLADKIVEAIDKQLSADPLIKAWTWFLKNPKFSAKKAEYFAKYITTTYVDEEIKKKYLDEGYTLEKATAFATYNDVAITKNGLLSTYKYAQIKYKMYNAEGQQIDRYDVVYDQETGAGTVQLPKEAEDYYLIPPIMGESGDAYFTGETLGHTIKVGQSHRLADWSQVDCRDGASCVPGLHLGGRKYIQGYGGHSRLLLNCFVNPMNIGGFTDDGSGAIRVKEYFVHSAKFAPNKAMYHESEYLAQSNAAWDTMREEAIAKTNEAIAKIQEQQARINAL